MIDELARSHRRSLADGQTAARLKDSTAQDGKSSQQAAAATASRSLSGGKNHWIGSDGWVTNRKGDEEAIANSDVLFFLQLAIAMIGCVQDAAVGVRHYFFPSASDATWAKPVKLPFPSSFP